MKIVFRQQRSLILLVAFFIPIAIIYLYHLSRVPVHLNQDELGFTLNGYSIAKTGFDENGRFLPFYFWHLSLMWATPIINYLVALFLLFLPVSETTIRLPSILVGFSNLILLYTISKHSFRSQTMALLAVFLLALSPAHFIQSRLLLDPLYLVPFGLGWFLCLQLFKESNKTTYLIVAGLLLGIGVHSYHAAKIIMPLLFLMTYMISFREIRHKPVLALYLLIAFALPLLPLIPWLKHYPDTLTDQVKYVRLYNTSLSPLEGLLSLLTVESISQRIITYLNYFQPYFLFWMGDSHPVHSTHRGGVFLIPFIILIPLGIYQALHKKNRSWQGIAMVTCFFLAPIAASFVLNQYRISKSLLMVPFGVLLAVSGIQFLWQQNKRLLKYLAILLLIIVPFEFGYFFYDYHTRYLGRSAEWFNYDIPGTIESMIAQNDTTSQNQLYVDNQIYFIDRYWLFYLIKHHKEELYRKVQFITPDILTIQAMQPGSLVMVRFDHIGSIYNFPSGKLILIKTITEQSGFPSFYIFKVI